ncbi:MAG: hypothetical protein ACC656_05255, partial [Candidatus Heimdallarchaeota archaeon]
MIINGKTLIIIVLVFSFLSITPRTSATYIEDGRIVILRSQFVDDGAININGNIDESFWDSAGLISLKITDGLSQDAEIQFRFANDDINLYIAFILLNYVYLDLSVAVYFDTDNNGVLSTPEDGKLVSFTKDPISKTLKDMYWDENSWQEDSSSVASGYKAGVLDLSSTNTTSVEMAIPLLSSDLPYDGLQVPSTSNSYIGLMFSVVNNYNNGTIETFEFPTVSTNASGYVDLKLAGPEDKDLPSYVPPVKITTTFTSTTTETFPANTAGRDAFSDEV